MSPNIVARHLLYWQQTEAVNHLKGRGHTALVTKQHSVYRFLSILRNQEINRQPLTTSESSHLA